MKQGTLPRPGADEAAKSSKKHADELLAVAIRFGLAFSLGVNTLYKFRSLRGPSRRHTFDILKRHRVYFARPDELNDPFDCAPRFALGGDPTDPEFVAALRTRRRALIGKYFPKDAALRRRWAEIDIETLVRDLGTEMYRYFHTNVRVFCASAELFHPLTWAHYAADHTGIALHFDTRPGNLFGLCRKVLYQSDREPFLVTARPVQEEDAVKLLLVKAPFWSYESEYRIIAAGDENWGYGFDDASRAAFEPELLSGITLGMRIGAKDRDAVLAHAHSAKPHIPVWQAAMHPEHLKMVAERIE